jgi:hypothetical protein
MTKQEAIKLMGTSVNVQDWNEKRELVKESMATPKDWENVYRVIDQNGMCTQTIRKNRLVLRRNE